MSGPTIHIACISHERGSVAPRTALNFTALAKARNVTFSMSMWRYDVVRARSLVACIFLKERKEDYLLFWDDDVFFEDERGQPCPHIPLVQMLSADEDFIATAYPKKKEPIEMPFVMLDGAKPQGGKLEIMWSPMGCTLLSRACIERMWNASAGLPMRNVTDGVLRHCRAMFSLVFTKEDMLPEDFSFSHRWRAAGGKVWLNLGSMGQHWGHKLYGAT